jgi:uncharacterized membrane protein
VDKEVLIIIIIIINTINNVIEIIKTNKSLYENNLEFGCYYRESEDEVEQISVINSRKSFLKKEMLRLLCRNCHR